MSYAISYGNNGTVNGKDVGRVYALHCPWIADDVWSYTREFKEATHFPTREAAEQEAAKHRWFAVEIHDAPRDRGTEGET